MSNILAVIGERLREERVRLGLTQEELATKAGMGKNSLLAYEKGKTPINIMMLMILGDFGVDLGYVLTARRASGDVNFEDRQMLDQLAKLSSRERSAIFAMVSVLTGDLVSIPEVDLQDLARKTIHDKQREYRGEDKE
jgi:transcriptional regulator with XRE-family HTH domain